MQAMCKHLFLQFECQMLDMQKLIYWMQSSHLNESDRYKHANNFIELVKRFQHNVLSGKQRLWKLFLKIAAGNDQLLYKLSKHKQIFT